MTHSDFGNDVMGDLNLMCLTPLRLIFIIEPYMMIWGEVDAILVSGQDYKMVVPWYL